MPKKTTWIMTTGERGMISQVTGLAEAIGFPTVEKEIRLKAPWSWLPGHLCPMALSGIESVKGEVVPPWPDVLITCGRRSVAVSLAIKKASGGKTFTVHIQNPKIPSHYFDLVVAPEHDQVKGKNVRHTLGAVHHVTPEKLAQAKTQWAPQYQDLPRPLIAVMVGGNTNHYRLTPELTKTMCQQLKSQADQLGGSLLMTPSRRTGEENIAAMQEVLTQSNTRIWDGKTENPYFAMLALADYLVVTCDSISMVSEACSTGKPVYVLPMEGKMSDRFAHFFNRLYDKHFARAFDGKIEPWQNNVLDETADVAKVIREKLASLG